MKVGRWRRSSRRSRSSHTKVCISALFAKWNCEKQMRSDVFLFSLNEGGYPSHLLYKYTSFFDSGKFVPCQIWKDVVFFEIYRPPPPENAAVARERRKKKHTSTWSLQGRWTYRARKGRSNACFGRYLFVLNSPIRCSYRHQPG